eukprot:TRINITY_DN13914_c0_g1_i2.p1 TRINITY_DN13914_c0_g1~~TRINITY_DN13914_c0_g1_i2.p1  ORF type:complete len:246 (-),score=47.68 TRINITY_DN13914_c0_g1_i2:43-780(-)
MARVLYDLVGKEGLRFSPFVWRAKAVLKYKELPYKTVPCTFTMIRSGTLPSSSRTVPVLVEQGKIVADSWDIAMHLENTHPQKKIFPHQGSKEAAMLFSNSSAFRLHRAIFPLVAPYAFEAVVDEDKDVMREKVSGRLSESLEQLQQREGALYEAYRQELAGLDRALGQMKETQSKGRAALPSPFLLGESFSYCDALLFATIRWPASFIGTHKALGEGKLPNLNEWWVKTNKTLGMDPEQGKYYE